MTPEVSGWVKGRSMSPSLIHGDLLRTETVAVQDLRPGMVCVFESRELDPVVHRITGLRNLKTGSIVTTRGDGSGRDSFRWFIENDASLRKVTGVLRAGRFRRPRSLSGLVTFVPGVLSRRLAGIVRRFLW